MQYSRAVVRHPSRVVAVVACLGLALSALAVAGGSATAATRKHGPAATASRPWLNARQPVGRRVDELLSRMTLDEKVQLMYGVARPRGIHSVGYVPGIARLGVPPLILSDGPVGVKDSCFGEAYPDNCELGLSTAMPATVSLAASFDPSLSYDYGQVIGSEARARGVDVLYGPAMNIDRVPQGGRNFEYYSEDPYLTGEMATSGVRGIQSEDVAAQVKHFVANNQENDRHGSSSNVDERTLREIYLPAFHQALTAGGADSMMCANNMVNGTYNCENGPLLNNIVKGEWGWDGVVGSDYAATNSALGSVNGGLDQEFTGRDWGEWYSTLPGLVRSGKVSEDIIDGHVRRVLTMMFKLKMFDPHRSQGSVDVSANGAASRRVAERGAVLLKNRHSMLPLDASSLRSIAVVGTYADTAMTGGGGSSHVKPYYSVSPVQGIKQRVGSGVSVTTADGTNVGQAATVASKSDVAVVVVNDEEAEGTDRANIDLPGNQNELITAVRAANPHTLVVLDTGGPVTMPWLSKVPALLEMWYPGEEDGNALAALLFGDVDPSGKLPVTFPASLAQDCCHTPPRYPEENHNYDYTERLQVGYRWYDSQHIRPLFPFGFGLSYTTFAYRNLKVSPKTVRPGHTLDLSFRVTNTGSRTGTTTPQAYLSLPKRLGEPPHRLVATRKVRLRPGQTKRVTMTVAPSAFRYWSTNAHNWAVSPGNYAVYVGSSSRDLPLRAAFRMQHTNGVQGIAVHAQQQVTSGGGTDLTVTLANSGDKELTHPVVRLRLPHGWSAHAISRGLRKVPAHDRAAITYRVHAPGSAGPGSYVITASAHWIGGIRGSATRAVTIEATVPTRS